MAFAAGSAVTLYDQYVGLLNASRRATTYSQMGFREAQISNRGHSRPKAGGEQLGYHGPRQRDTLRELQEKLSVFVGANGLSCYY